MISTNVILFYLLGFLQLTMTYAVDLVDKKRMKNSKDKK